MEDEPKFIDADQYQGSKDEPITYKIIVLSHLKNISKLISTELRGGFWQTKLVPSKDGTTKATKVYVPDAREPLTNSIDFFYYLIQRWIPQDDESKKKSLQLIKETYHKIDQLRVKCIQQTSVEENNILLTDSEDTMLLPSESYKDEDKKIIEMFKNIKVQYYRTILCELLRLFNGGLILDAPEYEDIV